MNREGLREKEREAKCECDGILPNPSMPEAGAGGSGLKGRRVS